MLYILYRLLYAGYKKINLRAQTPAHQPLSILRLCLFFPSCTQSTWTTLFSASLRSERRAPSGNAMELMSTPVGRVRAYTGDVCDARSRAPRRMGSHARAFVKECSTGVPRTLCARSRPSSDRQACAYARTRTHTYVCRCRNRDTARSPREDFLQVKRREKQTRRVI